MSAVEKLDSLEEENAFLKAEVSQLQEQLAWFKKQFFGSKSERFIDPDGKQMELPGIELTEEESDIFEEKKVKEHTRKQRRSTKKDKIAFPEDLPKETTILDIPDDQKICPETGEPLQKIGQVVTQKLAFKPGSYFIKEYIRPKYASKKYPELGVITAPVPEGIFAKGKADESLLAQIVTMKYAYHLPLYRIQEMLNREGIHISRQALSEWVIHLGECCMPLYEAMRKRILEYPVIFSDESPVRLLVKGQKKAKKSYMWVYIGGGTLDPPYRLFEFCRTRSYQYPLNTLKGYKGYLHSDKYGAYEVLAKHEAIIWCPCMAHARRYFVDAKSGDQKFCKYVLRYIRYLYMFEKIAKLRSEEERLEIRQEREKPIIQHLVSEVKDKLVKGQWLPKSKYMKALNYFSGISPYLENYLQNPNTHLDNNVSERTFRALAIGRKNWLFVGSEQGGQSAAVLISLVQTCRHLNINPQEYLEDTFREIMQHPSSRVSELLPDEWLKRRS